MYSNASGLQSFYSTLQGRIVERSIRRHIIKLWGNSAKGDRVLGYGYSLPYMPSLSNEAINSLSLLPNEFLPSFATLSTSNIHASICEDGAWPIESNSINRLLVIHSMNSEESVDGILKEAWRVLVGQGKMLILVPNRSGIWARMDNNPFGHGVPYSFGQLRNLLKEYNFTPERSERALFFPPSASSTVLATAGIWEKIGSNFCNALGGVNIIEASKQTYAGMITESASKVQNKKVILQTKSATTTANIYNKSKI